MPPCRRYRDGQGLASIQRSLTFDDGILGIWQFHRRLLPMPFVAASRSRTARTKSPCVIARSRARCSRLYQIHLVDLAMQRAAADAELFGCGGDVAVRRGKRLGN